MRKNMFCLLFRNKIEALFVALLVLFSINLKSQNTLEIVNKANFFFANKNYNDALPLYKKVILQDSLNSKVLYRIGVCLHHAEIEQFTIEKRNKNNREGFDYLLKAIQIDSTIAEYYRYAATTLLCSDQAQLGNKYALRAINLDNKDFDNWEILFRISNFDGSTYPQKNEKARKAVANYRQLLFDNTQDTYLYYALAMSYERCTETCDSNESVKNYDSTIYYFKEYNKLRPDVEFTYFKLDQMYSFHPWRRKLKNERMQNLKMWLEYASDKSEVYAGLFFIYYDMKNYAEADKYYIILNQGFSESFFTMQVNDAVKYAKKEFKWSKKK